MNLMAYTKKELEKLALKAIKQHNIVFIEDLVCFLPCCKSTFYSKNLHESNAIKDAMYQNRQAKKSLLREKWEESENATLQMGLYKLLANDNELERLNNNKHKIETDNKHKVEGEVNIVFENTQALPSSEDKIEDVE